MMQTAQYSQPPPPIPNLSVPPPSTRHYPQRQYAERDPNRLRFFQPFRPFTRPGPGPITDAEFDGKRLRKSVMRKTVDYNSAIIKMLESRVWQRDFRDRRALQPDVMYYPDLQPPPSYADNPINSVTTRFVKTATNKMRCPIFCMAWTPEGRRLVTGASSGEFTLWNGLTFNFETILQAHDSPVRTMVWSHNDMWMVTGDHAGYVKYWQSNMNNVKMFQAHKEAIRGLSFSPSDNKFVTCSDDGTLRIWDFMRCHEERILRGHGADVKCVHWHPQKGLIVSGSKDNQQPIKLWDPKSGQSLATLHAHKSTVMDIKWNTNGNWLVTASRDHLLKLFDLRNLSQEVQTFRGHKKEASSVAWHPYHEGLFASGGSDGAILFWHVGADKEVGSIDQAHDSIVWTLAWHPLGHILCSGSNDHTSKFWTRNRPGDLMRDKYNLNMLPAGIPGVDDLDLDEPAMIPGMGPEDKVDNSNSTPEEAAIPGLDFSDLPDDKQKTAQKKVPYSKPIPRNFQAHWNETSRCNVEEGIEDDDEEEDSEKWKGKNPLTDVITQLIETNPPPGVIPVSELEPQAIIIFGKILPVEGNTKLQQAIASGSEALSKLIQSGQLEELHDVMPHSDEHNHDTYINDEMDIDSESEGLPDPLSSSAYPHISSKERRRKSRFNDPNDHSRNMILDGGHNMMPMDGQDKDMRSIAMMRQQFPPNSVPDQDMRFSTGDMDLRQPPMMPMGDQDFRRLHINNNIRHDITMDEDLRGYGMDQPRFDDCDVRHFGDQDLRGNPNSQHQQNMMEMGDVDFRHNPQGNHQNMLNMNPLSVRPDQNSPNQGPNMGMGPPSNKDIDARRHGFGPESANMQNIDDNVDSSGSRKVLLNTPQQFTGGPLPRGMMDQNHWRGGPPNDQWAGNMPDQEGLKDIDNPNFRWGSRGSPRGTGGHYSDRGRGRNFGPDGLGSIEHGRGEPRGNFGPDGPIRGEPRGDFGLDGSGRGKLRGNFGLDGPDNMERGGEEARGNFGPDGRSRGEPRGNFGPDGPGRGVPRGNFGPDGPGRGEPRGNFGPDGPGRGEPRGNFGPDGPGRGEPRGNFGPDGPGRGEPRGNFGLDEPGRGEPRGNFGPDGPGRGEPRGNFGPDGPGRGEPRGNFGPDGPGRGEPRGNFGPDGPGRGESRGNFGPDELGRRESRGNFGLDELGSMGYGRGEPRGNFGPSGNFHPKDNFGQGRHMDENLLVPNFSPSENFGPGGNFGHGNFGPGGNFGPEDNFGPGNNFGPGDNFGPEENFDHGRNMKEGSNFEPQEEGELGSDREEGYAESEGRDGHWGGGSNFPERGGRFSSFRRGSRSRGFPRSRGDRGSRSGGRSRTRGKFRGRGRGGDTS